MILLKLVLFFLNFCCTSIISWTVSIHQEFADNGEYVGLSDGNIKDGLDSYFNVEVDTVQFDMVLYYDVAHCISFCDITLYCDKVWHGDLIRSNVGHGMVGYCISGLGNGYGMV